MKTVTSSDGTAIAFDQTGDGPPVVLVAGAFSYRKFPMLEKIAAALSENFTVVNYDRRGRGDSGDTAPYAVEREIEDIEALIEAVGGSAYVWGLSSGAVLSLRAAAAGASIKKLAIYQPPFVIDDSAVPPADFAQQLDALVAADRRSEAVKLMMTKGMGAPAFFINMMRLYPPMWNRLTALAHTLPYDFAIMGDTVWGRPLSPEAWAPAAVPTLVMAGSKAPERVRRTAEAAALALPDAEYRALPGQSHNVAPNVLAPVLREFFGS